MVSQLDKEKILEVNVLKVRGNALIFDNTIYQISNITSAQLNSSCERHKIPLPIWVKFLCLLALFLLAIAFIIETIPVDTKISTGIMSIVMILLSCWGYLSHKPYYDRYKYGLSIILTSGESRTFVSSDEEFIKKIVRSLYLVISDEENRNRAINYNFNTRKVINIREVSDSNIIGGDVEGDIKGKVVDNI